MADLLDFLPLRRETLDSIRARLDADANAGIDPLSDRYLDTTEGGFYWDLTQAVALEVERLWDALSTEYPAAAFPLFAWGEYLDDHAEPYGLTRRPAVPATGTVTFSGTDGTVVAIGTEVAAAAATADDDPTVFATTAGGTVAGGSVALPVSATVPGAAGNVAPAAVTLLLSPVAGATAVTNSASMSGGADVETDDELRARLLDELGGQRGAGTVSDYRRWALDYPGVGRVGVVPLWAGSGTVRVVVADAANTPVSAAVRDGLQAQLDPFTVSTTLNGAQATNTGTLTVASTTGFRTSGRAYVGELALTYTGLTGTTLTGVSGGNATVVASGTAVVQNGEGRGLAPIGAEVKVTSPSVLDVTVALTGTYETGFSAAGAGGTVAVGSRVVANVRDYIGSLSPGDDVFVNGVRSAALRVRGVLDVPTVTLNGSGALPGLAVASDQIARHLTTAVT